MDILILLEKCRSLGATFTPSKDKLMVWAPEPLPGDLVRELQEAKPAILSELRRQCRKESECWVLEEWRRVSIPDWRNILIESIKSHNTSREEYARWMLREVLEDTEYREEA